ncbi:hypothetical protein [Vibrio crassostreae]|uniref:hypothetical protein n=1 Tax=Vibrio crassostreae TaxID=246167 RepID=UPI0014044598|nr:hypothetical protein [Vibrio crassostreae]
MGVSHRSGISNKGQGKPYDMHKIHFATPIEQIDTPNMSLSGYGLQEQSIDIDPLCLSKFHDIQPLSELDVIVEPKPSNFSQTWVVGFNPI